MRTSNSQLLPKPAGPNLPPIQPSKQPTTLKMPASRAHGVAREEKARGKGPSQMAHCSTHPYSAPSQPWQTSLINHRLPSHQAEAQRGTSALYSSHQSCALEGSHFHACYHPPGPQVWSHRPPLGMQLSSGMSKRIRTRSEVGMTCARVPGIKFEAGDQKALAETGGISVMHTPVSPVERPGGSSRAGTWTLGPPGSWDAAQQALSLPPPGGGMSRCGWVTRWLNHKGTASPLEGQL